MRQADASSLDTVPPGSWLLLLLLSGSPDPLPERQRCAELTLANENEKSPIEGGEIYNAAVYNAYDMTHEEYHFPTSEACPRPLHCYHFPSRSSFHLSFPIGYALHRFLSIVDVFLILFFRTHLLHQSHLCTHFDNHRASVSTSLA